MNFEEGQVAGQLKGKVECCCDRKEVHRGVEK